MKIMVDLDRVVFDCSSLVFTLAHIIDKKSSKTNTLKYVEVNSEEAMRYPSALSFFKIFNDKSFTEIKGASKTLRNWHKQGFDILFVSSRPNIGALKRATVRWLNKREISYSKLIFSCNNKAEYCKQNNIDVMIDDNYKNCVNTTERGIPAIWLMNKHNEYDLTFSVGRLHLARNWRDIDNFVQAINVRKKNNSFIK